MARQARRTLDTAAEQGVHLILCGHLHVSHIEPLKVIPGDQRMVVASAGTATSNRWRASFRRTNVYNVVTVADAAFQIEERRYQADAARFVRDRRTRFERTPPPLSEEDA